MKKRTRFLSFLLMLLMIVPMIPFSAMSIFASSEEKTDAMTEIESTHSSSKIGETQTVVDDGFIGIPIKMTLYSTRTESAIVGPGLDSTPVIVYVVNTMATRTGTDSDSDIIADMLSKGYIVLVLDYQNNEKAVSPDLDWSVQGLLAGIRDGKYFPKNDSKFPSGKYQNTIVVPAGHNVTFNHVYFEMDKHAADGTLDRIVHAWNNDFRGVFAKTVVKWTRPDGTKKPTQNGFDGSAPVWYSDAAGTVADANGQYIMIKHTKAETITDCTKADGTPIDLNLYMHIVYPTNPANPVPVMSMACSSEQLASGLRTSDRPHVNGFLFDGYAISIFDHAYVPMSREDHYGYFDGNTMQGHITGDNISYTVNLYNMQKTETAAMRFMRYLALTEPAKYKFNLDAIGVVGNSKGSIINFLGAPELQIASNKAIGDAGIADQSALDKYVDTKINALMSQFDLPGHHGESRYQNGDTETVVKDGATIDGGTLQPWITYNGTEIASGANFVYANCGGTPQLVKEGYQPYYVSLHIGSGEQSGYTNQNYMVNLARQYDIPCLYFESSLGHTLVGREELNYGINPYNAYKDFANFVLNNGAIKVAYTTPLDKSMNVDTTANITVKFTGMAELAEVQKIVISDGASVVSGSWTSSFGGTEWTFHPNTMNSAAKYTITVPADFKGTNGVAMGTAYTGVFTTKGEAVIDGGISATTVTSTSGVNVEFTAPNMADYAAVNANQFLLRVKVSNDAANIANVYAVSSLSDTSTANLIGKANLKGDGYYDIDISSYMETVTAGEKVYLFIKAEKATSVSQTFSQTFDSTNGFATSGRGNYELTTAPDGQTSALKVTLNMKTGVNGLDYYINESQVLFNNKLFKDGALSDADYGRKFTVTMRVYDTTSRQLMLQISGRTNASNQIRDYQTPRYNVTTTANEWQTITMEYTVYDMEYGWAGYNSRAFQMYMSSDGDKQSPIYFDYINVTETVTDIEVSDVALVLANEGSKPYKAPESTENAFDVNGTSYATFKSALAGYTSGQTVKLLKNYTFTDSDITDLSAFANVVIDLNGYKLIAANTSKAPIYIKAADTNTVTVTVKNGTVLAGSSALISYNDSVAAGSGKTVNINFENVYIGLDDGAKTQKLITTNTATSGVKITSNITFTDCELDIDQTKHTNNPMIILPGESADIDINYNMLGGSIKVSSFTMTTVHESFNSLVLNKNASGNYPTLILPNSVVLGANSYRYGDTSGSFVLPAGGYDADGYTEYTLTSSELSTKYGVIPEQYADVEQYPFVLFDEMGNATGYADLINSAGTGALDKIKEIKADYSVIMRRDFALTSQSHNIAFIYGGVTLDLQGHTLDTKGHTLFYADAKRPNTTTFNVIDGTIIMKGAPLIAYAAANNSNYNVDTHGVKTFDFIFDNVNFTLNAGSTPEKMFTQTKTLSIRMDTSITLNDCVIDLTNLTKATTLFDLGSSNDLLYCDYQINGGNIIAPSLDDVTIYNKLGENAAMLFGKGSDGSYTTLTVPSEYEGATVIVPTTEGDMYFGTKLSDDGTTAVYELVGGNNITKYGVIPANAGSADEYPIALFANGKFIGAYKLFISNNSASLIVELRNQMYTKGNDCQVLLRKDYDLATNVSLDGETTLSNAQYDNWSHLHGELTIDLNGYQLAVGSGKYFYFYAKSNGETTITFTNGKLRVRDALFTFATGTGDASANKKVNINFDNVTLTKINAHQPFIKEYSNASVQRNINVNVTFKNSIIDYTGLSSLPTEAYAIVDFTTANALCTGSVTYIGGSILGRKLDYLQLNNGGTVTLEKGTDDYTNFVATNTSTAIPTESYKNESGTSLYITKDYEKTTTSQVVAVFGEKTAYGIIPSKYDAQTYPFAVFKDGQLLGAFTMWSDCADSTVNSAIEMAHSKLSGGGEIIILLRRNYTTSTPDAYKNDHHENFGNTYGTLIVDLNGFTLTAGRDKPLLGLQAKGSHGEKSLNVTFVDGNLVAKSAPLFWISTYGGDGLRTINLTLTNVKISRGTSGATSLNKGMIVYVNDTNTTKVTANIVLNNCEIDVKTNAPSSALKLFGLAGNSNYTTSVTINGGKILVDDMSKVTLYTGDTEDSFTFGKYSDAYTELHITSGSAPTEEFATVDDGNLKFVETTTAGVYTLAEEEVEPIVTPYGNIPGDTVLSTYAVFTGGNYIGTYSTLVQALDAANAQYTAGAEQVQIMLFASVTESEFYAGWSTVKDIVIDLNGNKLTKKGAAFNQQCKDSGTTTITFKNGELRYEGGVFIAYTVAEGLTNGKTLNLNFENITKVSSDADWQFVTGHADGVASKLELNITCNNVHFAYNAYSLFDIRSHDKGTTNALNSLTTATVKINGGTITMSSVSDSAIVKKASTGGTVVLKFGKYNGEYIKINTSTFSITDTFYTTYNVPAFSEVSTGVYSIVEPDIEIDGGTGGSFNDIQDAFDNATKDDVIVLNKDISGGRLKVEYATLDLNGKVLTVDSLAVFGILTIIDSGEGVKGLIKTEKDNVTFYEIEVEGGILVYNTTRGGYEIATVTDQSKYTSNASQRGFELIFRPALDNSTEYNELILGAGGDAANLTVKVNIEDENGNIIKGFVFDDALVKRAYSEKLALKLTVRNIPTNYDKLYVKYILSSGTGQYLVIDVAEYTR